MCQYHNGRLLAAIDGEKPLLGQPLDDVLAWQRPNAPPAATATPQAANTNGDLVLETIHYALTHGEKPR